MELLLVTTECRAKYCSQYGDSRTEKNILTPKSIQFIAQAKTCEGGMFSITFGSLQKGVADVSTKMDLPSIGCSNALQMEMA